MKILIAGDLCPRNRVATLIEHAQFETIVGNVKPIIEQADYALINFECPIVVNSSAKPIDKCGPCLRTTPHAIDFIKYAGFNGVTLANNHFMDYGKHGANDTLQACDKAGLDRVGGDINAHEAAKILFKEIDGKTVAFINCCEHEFSIATDIAPGCNPLNPVQQYYAITEAKRNADHVIVIVHGGHEYYQLPSPRMKETYRFFIDCGADAVINHHQHCYSGYEYYKDKFICYGLGNFCFDYPERVDQVWNEGYMVMLEIKDSIKVELFPYEQCNGKPTVVPFDSKATTLFSKNIADLNAIIQVDAKLKRAHEKWMDQTSKGFMLAFTPYSNRYFRAACSRGLLPSFISKQRVQGLINYIDCEAHRERTLNMLRKL